MASNIDPTKPVTGAPTTVSVRNNFVAAKSEIEALQTGKADSVHSHAISDVTNLGTALSGKQDSLVSGTNIKTINNESILGSGNITITGGGGGVVVKASKYSVGGSLTFGLTTGKLKWYPEENITITGVFFALGTAGSVAVNLVKNGSTQLLASNIVTGVSDTKSNTGVPGSPNILTTDYITVNIFNFGSTATDIVVHILYNKT